MEFIEDLCSALLGDTTQPPAVSPAHTAPVADSSWVEDDVLGTNKTSTGGCTAGPATSQLAALLTVFGRPVEAQTEHATRRRVTRVNGYASKIAELLTTVVAEVNKLQALQAGPVTLTDVLSQLPEGRLLLDAQSATREQRILAEAAVQIGNAAGRGCRAGVLGLIAARNAEGQLSTARVAALADASRTHVKASRAKVAAGDIGPLGSLSMQLGVKRKAASADIEKVSAVDMCGCFVCAVT
jgi:hypothetical protein